MYLYMASKPSWTATTTQPYRNVNSYSRYSQTYAPAILHTTDPAFVYPQTLLGGVVSPRLVTYAQPFELSHNLNVQFAQFPKYESSRHVTTAYAPLTQVYVDPQPTQTYHVGKGRGRGTW